MFSRLISICAVFASLALASPAAKPNLKARANDCKAVDVVISALHAPAIQSTVTGFCSSFLGIPLQTSTVTAPAVTVSGTPARATTTVIASAGTVITVSNPVHTTAATTVTVTSTGSVFTTTVATTTVTLGMPKKKRAVTLEERATIPPKPTVPAALKIFAEKLLSTACSCLSVPTSTVTTTKAASTVIVDGGTSTSTITSTSTTTMTTTVAGGSTITDTTITSTATVNTASTSSVTVTSTVLGIASQCAGAQISAAPARLSSRGNIAIAGTAQEVRGAYPVNNVQDCCSNCYLATSDCVAFTYGNFDNQQLAFPGSLDSPSTTSTCRIYRDVFGDCANDVSVFDTHAPPVSGEVNLVGIGPCTPDLSL